MCLLKLPLQRLSPLSPHNLVLTFKVSTATSPPASWVVGLVCQPAPAPSESARALALSLAVCRRGALLARSLEAAGTERIASADDG